MMALAWRPRSATTRIILHDQHAPRPAEHLPSPCADWLLANGRAQGLLAIGYHYVIERDGGVVVCRPNDAIGSHTPGHNHDSIGICLAGGHAGEDDFTEDQLYALKVTVGSLWRKYGPLQLLGHSEVKHRQRHGVSCPAIDMNVVRDMMTTKLSGDHLQTPAVGTLPDTARSLSTQNRLILDYLKAGRTLTNQIALVNLGIGSLSKRVAELRALGHPIKSTEAKDHFNRRYVKYTLEKAAEG